MSQKFKALAGIAVASALLLTGCSGGDTSSGSSANSATETSTDLSAEAQAALDIITAASQPYDEFVAPGPALEGLDDLAGETVYYMAANQSVPMFGIIADSLSEALAQFDIKVQVCDAKANPQDAATCMGQAIDAGAAAFISGSIPEEMATTAFQQVKDAGIPLLFTQVQPEGDGDPTKIGYVSPDNAEMQGWNSNWIIADSNAQANVLVVKVTDTPATIAWTEFGSLPTFEEGCSDCVVEVIEAHTGQLEKLPSLISAKLVANPDIQYVQSPFVVMDDPIVQGIQAAGNTDIKVVSGDSSLKQMQELSGGRFLASVVGNSSPAFGWYIADETLRMMSGEPSVQGEPFPFRRLFTQEIASDLDLTAAGEESGSWYGEADYRAGFNELWNVG